MHDCSSAHSLTWEHTHSYTHTHARTNTHTHTHALAHTCTHLHTYYLIQAPCCHARTVAWTNCVNFPGTYSVNNDQRLFVRLARTVYGISVLLCMCTVYKLCYTYVRTVYCMEPLTVKYWENAVNKLKSSAVCIYTAYIVHTNWSIASFSCRKEGGDGKRHPYGGFSWAGHRRLAQPHAQQNNTQHQQGGLQAQRALEECGKYKDDKTTWAVKDHKINKRKSYW